MINRLMTWLFPSKQEALLGVFGQKSFHPVDAESVLKAYGTKVSDEYVDVPADVPGMRLVKEVEDDANGDKPGTPMIQTSAVFHKSTQDTFAKSYPSVVLYIHELNIRDLNGDEAFTRLIADQVSPWNAVSAQSGLEPPDEFELVAEMGANRPVCHSTKLIDDRGVDISVQFYRGRLANVFAQLDLFQMMQVCRATGRSELTNLYVNSVPSQNGEVRFLLVSVFYDAETRQFTIHYGKSQISKMAIEKAREKILREERSRARDEAKMRVKEEAEAVERAKGSDDETIERAGDDARKKLEQTFIKETTGVLTDEDLAIEYLKDVTSRAEDTLRELDRIGSRSTVHKKASSDELLELSDTSADYHHISSSVAKDAGIQEEDEFPMPEAEEDDLAVGGEYFDMPTEDTETEDDGIPFLADEQIERLIPEDDGYANVPTVVPVERRYTPRGNQ